MGTLHRPRKNEGTIMVSLESMQAYATANNEYPGANSIDREIPCPKCHSTDIYVCSDNQFESCCECGYNVNEEDLDDEDQPSVDDINLGDNNAEY